MAFATPWLQKFKTSKRALAPSPKGNETLCTECDMQYYVIFFPRRKVAYLYLLMSWYCLHCLVVQAQRYLLYTYSRLSRRRDRATKWEQGSHSPYKKLDPVIIWAAICMICIGLRGLFMRTDADGESVSEAGTDWTRGSHFVVRLIVHLAANWGRAVARQARALPFTRSTLHLRTQVPWEN